MVAVGLQRTGIEVQRFIGEDAEIVDLQDAVTVEQLAGQRLEGLPRHDVLGLHALAQRRRVLELIQPAIRSVLRSREQTYVVLMRCE
jgi:hypothetical protein